MEKRKKIIITSKTNLKHKYGNKFSKVELLLQSLISSDKKRNIESILAYIDDAISLKNINVNPVKTITRPSCKKIVDEIYNSQNPDYILIFGAGDIIPFQELANPVPYDPNEDNDLVVLSDLPYSCNTLYSTNPGAFVGPTRVVGRLPDVNGQPDIAYIEKIIHNITTHVPKHVSKFLDYFSVTAEVWKKSTSQSLINIFGNSAKLKLSPPSGGGYSLTELKPLIHFYNCHGSPIDAQFYGQKGETNFPVAISSVNLNKKVSSGTVVAAECCYGAELFNPTDEGNRKMGIANTYLGNNAIAFVGSSTIAYGPPTGQGLADLITQYFIKGILAGASSGRAFIEAQQKFIANSSVLDPYELKTVAQFCLLGDPSIQPVEVDKNISGFETTKNRRINLMLKGSQLKKSAVVAKRIDSYEKNHLSKFQKELNLIIDSAEFGKIETEYIYVAEHRKLKNRGRSKKLIENQQIVYRVYTKKQQKLNDKISNFTVLVVKEEDQQILSWRLYHKK